jgi:hypothetical protein
MKTAPVAFLLFVVSCVSAFTVTVILCAALRPDHARSSSTCAPSAAVVTVEQHGLDAR